MAKQTINLGTGELTGDGESIRSAFDKINDNFTETYNDIATNLASAFDGDYNSLSNKPVLFSGDYNDLSNQPTLFDGAFSSLSGTPTTLAGYGISDAIDTSAINTTDGGTYKKLTFDGSSTEFIVNNLGDILEESITLRTIDSTTLLYGSRGGTTVGGRGAGITFIYHDDGTYRIGQMRPDVLRNSGKIPKLVIDAKWVRNELNNTIQAYTNGDSVIDIKADTVNIDGHISIADLKTLVAASTDFAGFQARIAAL